MMKKERMKNLKVSEDKVRNVMEEERSRLGEVKRNKSKYDEIMN
jgi:hypothetical protein